MALLRVVVTDVTKAPINFNFKSRGSRPENFKEGDFEIVAGPKGPLTPSGQKF